MKRTLSILGISCLFLCILMLSSYAFSTTSADKETAPSPPAVSQDSETGNTVDMELNDEEQTDDSLQVKAMTEKAPVQSSVEGITTEEAEKGMDIKSPKLR